MGTKQKIIFFIKQFQLIKKVLKMFKLITSLVVICIAVSAIDSHKHGHGGGWGWWFGGGFNNLNLATQCNANPTKGYYNGTYFAYRVSASQCCADCIANSTCYSFSYNRREYTPCYQVGQSTVFISDSRYTSGLVNKNTVTAAPVTVAPVTVAATCSVVQTDVKYSGTDLVANGLTANSYTECCTLCGNTAGCTAWTYSAMTKICFVKSSQGTAISFPGFQFTSGILDATTTTTIIPATTTTTAPETGCFIEANKSYTGQQISAQTVADLSACCNLCGQTALCAGFTFTTSTLLCSLQRAGYTESTTTGTFTGIKV